MSSYKNLMKTILLFIKNWTLPIAMCIGAIGHNVLAQYSHITPWLILCMLFLTFSKLSIKELKPEPMHAWILLVQIVGGLFLYILLRPFHPIVAQGAMICVLMPTATAAPVITGKLGGNIASITTFTLISNMAVAIVAPICFPLIESGQHPNFITGCYIIIKKVFPLILGPCIVAQIIRQFIPKLHKQITHVYGAGFYIWAISLTIVTAQTVHTLLTDTEHADIALYTSIAALITCLLQFHIGKRIGAKYNKRISGGQSLGQKNTILAIWMTHAYLNPVAAIAPGTYVLWQNMFNSWQLWRKRKQENLQQ